MGQIPQLFENNRKWAEDRLKENPDFFNKLASQQAPRYLWIGCADSRVPANQICGLDPGEVFVHRNVANLVVHSDMNCFAVVQFAVEVLKVKDIIVCGHYGCGGVAAALANRSYGIIDNWIRNIRDVYNLHSSKFESVKNDPQKRVDLLCELNVKEQVLNLCKSNIIQKAWKSGEDLKVHGWIYAISNGLLKDLEVTRHQLKDIDKLFLYD